MSTPLFEVPPDEGGSDPARDRRQDRDAFVDQFMYLLTAPMVSMPGWEDTVSMHKDDITMQRLAHGREIFEQEMCTEYEAMLYVSSVSLDRPMRHEGIAIYAWLFRRWRPDAADDIGWEDRDLDPTEADLLNQLRRWIFRIQMNRLKSLQQGPDQKEVEQEKQDLEIHRPRLFE